MNQISHHFTLEEKHPNPTKSAYWQHLLHKAKAIANSACPVLITGETGSGKSHFARQVYEQSNTYKKTLRVISLSEISTDLFESELFGYRKGSFTGAINDFDGKIKSADGGTLLLEDINCLPLSFQSKLLRVIQEKTFERVGASEPVTVDVRIIVTSNENLKDLSQKGKFRSDLFYRLNMINFNIHSLNERPQDILPFARYYLNKYTTLQGKKAMSFTNAMENYIMAKSWKGNVRELEGFVARQVSFADEDALSINGLNDEDLQEELKQTYTLKDHLKREERLWIVKKLIKFEGQVKLAAKELGMTDRNLYLKIKEYDIKY